MSVELQFALSTLALWAGVFFAARAALLAFRWMAKAPGDRPDALSNQMVLSLGIAAVLLLAFKMNPVPIGRVIEGNGITVPVVWIYTHFWGWAVAVSAVAIVMMLIQARTAISEFERNRKFYIAIGWIAFGRFAHLQFSMLGLKVTIFRGAFNFQISTLAAMAVVLLISLAFIAFSAKRAESRTRGKTIWTHLTLLVGCVLFGMPFAWLLSSSFKEDKDMSGGIVWIPRVTEEVPYFDPKERRFETNFEGVQVTATLIENLPNNIARLDVVQPMSMRGRTVDAPMDSLKEVPKLVPIVTGEQNGVAFRGMVIGNKEDGSKTVKFLSPDSLKDKTSDFPGDKVVESRPNGLRWKNYPEALQYLPPETQFGLVYLKNTLILVVLSVIGTVLSCSVVAYGFSRLRFPGRGFLFSVLLSTMMLPGAVTLMPQFLIFKSLGWIDTLLPLWVPACFAGAFNVFLLRQFFGQIPMELEDAAKIDGCNYLTTFWRVMMPQIKPALAVIAIWTFMGTWNNFMGPLIYINSPEQMPIAYALQLFNGERGGEPGLLMAFATMTMVPVLALFFFAQKYFIEGVSLSGLGGR